MRAELRGHRWNASVSEPVRPDRLAEYRERHEDYEAALDAMAATEVNERWQAEMSGYFVNDGPPDQSFLRVAEIFHLD